MDTISKVKLYTLANSLAENALDQIEKEFDINMLRGVEEPEADQEYYLQFEAAFRKESKEMGKHYAVFYCLERSIRSLITQLMIEKFGVNWWEDKVKVEIKQDVEKNIKKEQDSGYTRRSENKIDYTTFGQLTEIVTLSWDAFDDLFTSKSAFLKIMSSLNLLRGPIAHCCPLAEDEIVRLEITVKDWFRLME